MNVLIIDTDKYNLYDTSKIFQALSNGGIDDWVAIPKDFSILMDVSIDWMKMIRDVLDEKIRALESDGN